MKKIVINACYGGFSLSKEAIESYQVRTGTEIGMFGSDVPRDNPVLVAIVEEMGRRAAGGYAQLKVVEIPVDVEWTVEQHDGREWIAEKHRTWN